MTISWLLFVFLSAFIPLQSTATTFPQDWPLPALRLVRRQLRNRNLHVHYQGRVRYHDFSSDRTFYTDLFECFRNIFASSHDPQNPPEQIPESTSTDLPPTATQKTCEICMENVELSNCFRCCSNSHDLHLRCFANLFLSTNRATHKCPLCREQLISNRTHLHSLIIETDPQENPEKWAVISGHVQIFKLIRAAEMVERNWSPTFYQILTKSKSDHLRAFLDLDLIDVNHTFDSGECAVSVLFHGLYLYHLETQRVKRLQGNFEVLLSHPHLRLNRFVGIGPTRRHLIYHAITANLFDAFLLILDASPQIDLAAIFRHVSEISHRELFFYYLLTCKSFDLFEPDEYNCSALHIAVRNGHTSYALAILKSSDLTPEHLLARDSRNGRTVLHTAMVSSLDEVVDKLTLTFAGIDWDIEDYSGKSVVNLYENRI